MAYVNTWGSASPPPPPRLNCPNIYYSFDLTSTQEFSPDFIHPVLTNCTISVEHKFGACLGNNVELLFMGERASTVFVRSDRNFTKKTLMI